MSHGAEIKALCEMPAPICLGKNSLPNAAITALILLADMFEILFHEKYGFYKTCCKMPRVYIYISTDRWTFELNFRM
jgi:hypothetical protein